MRKLLVISLLLVGCKKEETNCHCGLIVEENINDKLKDIRNDCTGNTKKFYFTSGDWSNHYPGENICLTNQSKW